MRSAIGPLVFVGTDGGEVLVYEMLTCAFFKALHGVAGVGARGSSHGVAATAVACHPSMMDADGSGEDVVFVGHSDGTAVALTLKGTAIRTTFTPPIDYVPR